MKPKEIQDLLDYIAKTGLEEVNIETEQVKISVKKSAVQQSISPAESTGQQIWQAPQPVQAQKPAVAPESKTDQEQSSTESKPDEDNLVPIKSPMIGTFYRSADPESDPYVSVGDHVNTGQTVCIIEAMKLFNEIEAEVSGKVVKVLAENASPVEYDQPLFLVDPSA